MKTFAPVLPLLPCLAIALGCNTPPKDPPPNGPELPAASAAPDASKVLVATASATATAMPTATTTASTTAPALSSSSAVTAKPVSCSGDGDCRTFSSYCAEAPCACKVLGKADGDPKCLGSGAKVSCFVDPCLKKAAHCQSGACVLTVKGPAGNATER